MTKRYYISFQAQIYRVPKAALIKLAAGDDQGFWNGVTEIRKARYTELGWRQSGMPKGLQVDGGYSVYSVDENVVFVEVFDTPDLQELLNA